MPTTINGTPGNDIITSGTAGDEIINGLGGDDRIEATFGTDVLDGGIGTDTLSFRNSAIISGNLSVQITLNGSTAANVIYYLHTGNYASSPVPGISTSFVNFENVWGTDFGDFIVGDNLANELAGFGGDDSLSGGTGAANTLIGGAGNDSYTVSTAGDSIVELANEGTDIIYYSAYAPSISITLPNNVENISPSFTSGTTSATLIGNGLDNVIRGSVNADFISAGAGNDTLYDNNINATDPSVAADTLIGGPGNDTYFVYASGDSVIEQPGEGFDVVVGATTTIILGPNIENLFDAYYYSQASGVYYPGGGSPHNFYGNAGDNRIVGGISADLLSGGGGNDILDDGSFISVYQNSDTLFGGTGNDIFNVHVAGDSVIEYVNEGYDEVRTPLDSFTLPDNVEGLTYTSPNRILGVFDIGDRPFTGIGNASDNVISGGQLGDFLSGLGGNDVLIGGSGADTLIGGAGADQFRYLNGETGIDRILDFTPGTDTISLSIHNFYHTQTVDLVQTGGPVATSANSTFLYDTNSGMLSYDPDGTGIAAPIQLAQLNWGLTLSSADFIFV